MKIETLLNRWKSWVGTDLVETPLCLQLRRHDLARLEALVALYPGHTTEFFASELISAALDEVEAALPYIQGDRVVAEDDHGDPIYEDIGPNRRFFELTRERETSIEEEIASQNPAAQVDKSQQ